MDINTTIILPSTTPQPTQQYAVVLGDEDIPPDYKGRTGVHPDDFVGKCTPSVFRFESLPREPKGEYLTNVSPIEYWYIRLNGVTRIDVQPNLYLFDSTKGLFNNGYPKQSNLVMSGNKIKVLGIEGNYVKFETLTGTSDVSKLTTADDWLVHKWDFVCYDKSRVPSTYHKTTTDSTKFTVLYHYLISPWGYGYINKNKVRML